MNSNLLIKLRKKFFWFTDLLKGGKVKKHYLEIDQQYKGYNSISSRLKREKQLNDILDHANKTVNYYKSLSNLNNITDYPVVNKNIIRENLSSFLSANYSLDEMNPTTTSGSTGVPFTIYRDKLKLQRHQADNIYFSQLTGYELGHKLFYLRVWNQVNYKPKILQFIQNVIPVEISNLSDKNIKNFLDSLQEDTSEKHILSFSSSLEIIAKYIQKNELKLSSKYNVKSITGMSESLTDGAREILEAFFNCVVFLRYSNMENGFIGQEDFDRKYIINHSSFFVEILNFDTDQSVQKGELGRIVVTDLYNYGMPLIRYDTGDAGILLEGDRGPYLAKVEGRKVDFITDTSDEILSPHIITNTMWKYSSINQFQFIQEDLKKFLIKINIEEDSYDKKESLIKDLKQYLGVDAEIEIEIVNEIPTLSSGKRKKIIGLYKKNN